MDLMRHINDVLAFLLELVALAALGYWGFKAGSTAPIKVGLAIGAPLAAAILWGLFAAPKATITLPLLGVLAVKALVFGTATLAMYATGHRVAATSFAVIVSINVAVALTVTTTADQ